MISGPQIRAARGLLNWGQRDLVKASGVSLATIQRMESLGTYRSSAGNLERVVMALQEAGIEFIEQNGGGAGVRFREARSTRNTLKG